MVAVRDNPSVAAREPSAPAAQRVRSRGAHADRGGGRGGSFAAWLLQRSDFQRMYSIVGIVDDDPAKQGMRFEGLKVLGTTADIPTLVISRTKFTKVR